MTLPELSLAAAGRRDLPHGQRRRRPGADPAAGRRAPCRHACRRSATRRCRCSIPRGPATTEIRGVRPPGEFERAVAAAVERIRGGDLTKVVLAREVVVEAPAAHDAGGPVRRPARALPAPASASAAAPPRAPSSAPAPSSWCGARARAPRPWRSPARPGAAPTRPSTTTSASSCCAATRTATSRRSSPAASSARSSRTRSGSSGAREPEVIKVANIQHLATPIVAQLTEPRSAIEMAGLLHPDPGGRRRALAAAPSP